MYNIFVKAAVSFSVGVACLHVTERSKSCRASPKKSKPWKTKNMRWNKGSGLQVINFSTWHCRLIVLVFHLIALLVVWCWEFRFFVGAFIFGAEPCLPLPRLNGFRAHLKYGNPEWRWIWRWQPGSLKPNKEFSAH